MFDSIVITAANEAQARGYRAQTRGDGRVTVIADPGGRRVGSLGATVNALRRLRRGGRVLVCHSGGDARRTPGYAAMGKAFIPLRDGRSIFAHIVEAMEKLPLPEEGGLVVVSGDVLLTFDYASADFSRPGVTGVAYRDGPFQATRHGVYVTDALRKRGAVCAAVRDFLQKPQVAKGRFLIDTGILFIDWPTAEKMRALPVAGDIYEEFPRMLLGGFAGFSVNVMPKCDFFHVGSSREILDLLGDGRTYVDAVGCPLDLAGDNVVTNVPAGRFSKLSLGRGECLTCLPVGRDGWYDLRYRIGDNFKADGLWERHGLGEKMKKIDYSRLLAVRDRRPQSARVERPLRLDLAGGWSDTPPICHENGGCVLNAALTLEGCRPVVAEVRRIPEREVRVESVDLGERGVLRKRSEIYGEKDPHDWCALVKSALTVTGYEFSEGGLDIRIFADVPKGSGMGTSSILGASLVEALLTVAGREHDPQTVGETTLELERVMRTGGGWEDQLGALYPGVKLLTTRPGERQVFRVKRLPAAAERAFAAFLRERGVLYFTGQKRMARNVLRGVLDFYARNPDGIAHAIIRALKRDAADSFRALSRGDFATFTRVMNAYWLNKKALDPGSTNAQVESIIARIAPWADAVTLAGAGGGGFLFAVAKSRAARRKMEQVLSTAGNGGRCYRFALDC